MRTRLVLLTAAALAVAGCTSTVSGNGGASGGPVSSGHSSSADFPSQASTPPASISSAPSSSTPSTPTPSPTYRVVTTHPNGSDSGPLFTLRIYASDAIADCAAHAYGSIVTFLRQHPCAGAHRAIATTELNGRTVVVSAIATGFRGTADDPYGTTGKFSQLENKDGTGSINDLFREGHTIPGVATRIPAHEVFQTVGQDSGITVFDAWYASGATPDHDKALKMLEQDLFLTPLTS